MPTLAERLANAMKASGYDVEESDDRLAPVITKLQCLADCGRFGCLLSDLFVCNDKSNLQALLFEVVFAWHFERKWKPLQYEVVQHPTGGTTVDFLQIPVRDTHIYYELRLLQQQEAITVMFEEQLQRSNYFGTLLNGKDEQHEVLRLQQVLLGKVQDRKGKPVKFFSAAPPNCNILVVDVSQPLLGMIDKSDCILACYGDESVFPTYRRDVFGLFQVESTDAPPLFQQIARKFDHLRSTIHGILFMRRPQETNAIDFELQSYFIPNRVLLSENTYEIVSTEVASVFSPWEKKSESITSA